jgi:hypothetical protein
MDHIRTLDLLLHSPIFLNIFLTKNYKFLLNLIGEPSNARLGHGHEPTVPQFCNRFGPSLVHFDAGTFKYCSLFP